MRTCEVQYSVKTILLHIGNPFITYCPKALVCSEGNLVLCHMAHGEDGGGGCGGGKGGGVRTADFSFLFLW